MFGQYCSLPRFPADRILEARSSLDSWKLGARGLLLSGSSFRLQLGDDVLAVRVAVPMPADVSVGGCRQPHDRVVTIDGTSVKVVVDYPPLGGRRYYWLCPECNRRIRLLFIPKFSCKRCCGYDNACRHGGPPELHRVVRLRRRAGLALQPFTPVPKRQPRYRRYARLAAAIAVEERALFERLKRVNRDLSQRRNRQHMPHEGTSRRAKLKS